jgi:transcription initiation factor TFIID subunit TAF12
LHKLALKSQKTPAIEARLMALHAERTDAMLHLIHVFTEIREIAQKRLNTTVEGDKTLQQHFEDVRIREEKAMSEKQQLQQQLKLDRIQWQQQRQELQLLEDTASNHLAAMKVNHTAQIRSLERHNDDAQQRFDAVYSECAPVCMKRYLLIHRHRSHLVVPTKHIAHL